MRRSATEGGVVVQALAAAAGADLDRREGVSLVDEGAHGADGRRFKNRRLPAGAAAAYRQAAVAAARGADRSATTI